MSCKWCGTVVDHDIESCRSVLHNELQKLRTQVKQIPACQARMAEARTAREDMLSALQIAKYEEGVAQERINRALKVIPKMQEELDSRPRIVTSLPTHQHAMDEGMRSTLAEAERRLRAALEGEC